VELSGLRKKEKKRGKGRGTGKSIKKGGDVHRHETVADLSPSVKGIVGKWASEEVSDKKSSTAVQGGIDRGRKRGVSGKTGEIHYFTRPERGRRTKRKRDGGNRERLQGHRRRPPGEPFRPKNLNCLSPRSVQEERQSLKEKKTRLGRKESGGGGTSPRAPLTGRKPDLARGGAREKRAIEIREDNREGLEERKEILKSMEA